MDKNKKSRVYIKLVVEISFFIAFLISITFTFILLNIKDVNVGAGDIIILALIFVFSFFIFYLFLYNRFNIDEMRYYETEEEQYRKIKEYLNENEYKRVFYKFPKDDNNVYAALIEHFDVDFFARIDETDELPKINLVAKYKNGKEIFNQMISEARYFNSFFKTETE